VHVTVRSQEVVTIICLHLLSPGFLNRCRLYQRGEPQAPEKCWDRSARPDLPASVLRDCPNNTAARVPVAFTQEQLTTRYRLSRTPKSSKKVPWDHEGGYDERPLEPERDEET